MNNIYTDTLMKQIGIRLTKIEIKDTPEQDPARISATMRVRSAIRVGNNDFDCFISCVFAPDYNKCMTSCQNE